MNKYKHTYQRIVSGLVIVVSLLGLVRIPAYALSPEEKAVVDKGSVWHKIETPNANSCSSVALPANTPVSVIGNDNEEKTFRFFVANGLSNEQAAGITGNAYAESGINPKSVSATGGFSGMFQWDTKGRFANLKKWTTAKGLDPLSIEGQLQFALYEATERGNIAGIKKPVGATPQATVELAAWYWGRFFEGAVIGGSSSTTPLTNVQGLSNRIKGAKITYGKYGGSVPSSSLTAAVPAANASCTVGNGQATSFIDGFTVYSQYDPAWAKLAYSSSTIAESGCGPSAMAMIITALTGTPVTPVQTAQYAAAQDQYVPGSGSKWSIGPRLALHWGLKSQPISNDLAKITQALQSGSLIVAVGHGPKPFTTGGHFIVIRGITASGKFKVGDSGHSDTSNQEWDPQAILQSMSEGGAYAISK